MKYFAGQIPLRLFTGSRGCTKNTSNSLRTESKKFVRMCRPTLGTIALNLKIPQTCPSVVWDQMRWNSHNFGGMVHFGRWKKRRFGPSSEIPTSLRAYFEEMRLKDKRKPTSGLHVDSWMIPLTSIFEPRKYGDFKKLTRLTTLVRFHLTPSSPFSCHQITT